MGNSSVTTKILHLPIGDRVMQISPECLRKLVKNAKPARVYGEKPKEEKKDD